MMYLNALGQPIVVINSLKVALELLDRRGNIYSYRPHLIVANGILCGESVYSLKCHMETCSYALFLTNSGTYRYYL
jgi:hypothetical protein